MDEVKDDYSSKYSELELLSNNANDCFRLYLVREVASAQYKMAKKMRISEAVDNLHETLNEVRILRDLKNPHVIRFDDVFVGDEELIVISEFCQEGDLEHYLQRRKERKEHISEKLLLSWLMQMLMALEFVHSHNIIHRMLCSRNVYLNHQGDLKLGSFGDARTLCSTMQKAMTIIGAPSNLSPEAVQGKPYDSKIDIWALGCLVYELATFKHPYQMKSLPELYDSIVKSPPLELPVRYSKYLSPIYKKMMKKNPNYRPSAAQLLQEQVFLRIMKQYTKKKKIDALDLRQITPKQLAIHKKAHRKVLPPLKTSPNCTDKKTSNNRTSEKPSVMENEKRIQRRSSQSREKVTSPKLTSSASKKQKKSRESASKVKTNQSPKIKKEIICTYEGSQQSNRMNLKQRKNSDPKIQESAQSLCADRITESDLSEGEYISMLCQIKLEILEARYSPNMSKIFEQTVQFDAQ